MAYKVEIDRAKSPFSPRVDQVVVLVMEGQTREAVGLALHIAECTVNTHLQHAFNKAGVDNIAALMTKLYADGVAKAKKLVLCFLVVTGCGQAVLPSDAYASESGEPVVPMNRLQTRGGARTQTGNRLQLRRPTRRRED